MLSKLKRSIKRKLRILKTRFYLMKHDRDKKYKFLESVEFREYEKEQFFGMIKAGFAFVLFLWVNYCLLNDLLRLHLTDLQIIVITTYQVIFFPPEIVKQGFDDYLYEKERDKEFEEMCNNLTYKK